MAKKTIKTLLKIKENEILSTCQALVQNHSIQYIENTFKMKIDFTNDVVKMLRKNEEYEIFFHFEKENTFGMITLLGKGSISLDIQLKELKISEEKLLISYLLNGEDYEYSIDY